MMNINQLDACILESERFIAKAKQAKGRLLDEHCKPHESHFGCSQTAAARRASLDLTKKLAELRKPR